MMDTIMSFAQDSRTTYTADIWWIISVVGMWAMFNKAGEPGWPAIIPFYNSYKMCEITMGNPWYWLRLFVFFIPIFGWIAGFYFLYQMCKAIAVSYGKPETWAFGLMFLSPIFYCILGFGDAEYYGIMGEGDNRTNDAREAKTVNFDVVKNQTQNTDSDKNTYMNNNTEPVVEPYKPEEPAEETVDFFFDQPEE